MILREKKDRKVAIFLMICFLFCTISFLPQTSRASLSTNAEIILLVDGKKISSVKRFSYRRIRNRPVALSSGLGEPPGMLNRAEWVTRGRIFITESSAFLKNLMYEGKKIDIVLSLEDQSHSSNTIPRQIVFEDCRIVEQEVQVTANGSLMTTYFFNAEQIDEE